MEIGCSRNDEILLGLRSIGAGSSGEFIQLNDGALGRQISTTVGVEPMVAPRQLLIRGISHDRFEVSLTGVTSGIFRFQLIDVMGRNIGGNTLEVEAVGGSARFVWDFSGARSVPSGVYLVRARDAQGAAVARGQIVVYR